MLALKVVSSQLYWLDLTFIANAKPKKKMMLREKRNPENKSKELLFRCEYIMGIYWILSLSNFKVEFFSRIDLIN